MDSRLRRVKLVRSLIRSSWLMIGFSWHKFGSNTVARGSSQIQCMCLRCGGFIGNLLTILCLSVPLFSLPRWICVVWSAKFMRRGSKSMQVGFLW
jgi:hypothetical protein